MDLEKFLLGSCLLDNELIPKLIPLSKSRSFHKKANEIVFRTICHLYSIGESVDWLTVTTRLKEINLLDMVGGVLYLTNVIDAASAVESPEDNKTEANIVERIKATVHEQQYEAEDK